MQALSGVRICQLISSIDGSFFFFSFICKPVKIVRFRFFLFLYTFFIITPIFVLLEENTTVAVFSVPLEAIFGVYKTYQIK